MSSYIDKSKKKLAPKAVARRPLPEPTESASSFLTPPPTQLPKAQTQPTTSSPTLTTVTNRSSPVNTQSFNRTTSPPLDISEAQHDTDGNLQAATSGQEPVNSARRFGRESESHESQEQPSKRRRTQHAVGQINYTTTNEASLILDVEAAEPEVQSNPPTLAQILSNEAIASRNATIRRPNALPDIAQSDNRNRAISDLTSDETSSKHPRADRGQDGTAQDDAEGADSNGNLQMAMGLPGSEPHLQNVKSASNTERAGSGSARKAFKPRAMQRKPQSAETPLDHVARGSDSPLTTSISVPAASTDKSTSGAPDLVQKRMSKTTRNASRGMGTRLREQGNSNMSYAPASQDAADATSSAAPPGVADIEDSALRDALLADIGSGPSDSNAAQSRDMETGAQRSEARQRSRQKRKVPRMRAQTANDDDEVTMSEHQEVNAPDSAIAAETAEDLNAAGLTEAPKASKQLKPKPVRRRNQGDVSVSDRGKRLTEGQTVAKTFAKRQPDRERRKRPIMEDTVQDPDSEGDEEQASQTATTTTGAIAAEASTKISTSTSSVRKGKRKSAQKEAYHRGSDDDHEPGPSNEDTNDSSHSDRTSAENAAENDELGPPRKKGGRRRQETPDDAESHTIDPKTMTMAELCKDRKRGKKSKLETEMQNIDWNAVAERRKEAEEKARAAALKAGKKAGNLSRTEARRQLNEAGKEAEAEADAGAGDHAGPQLQVVDGDLVVDQTSLVVKRHAPIVETQDAVEENDLTKKVTSASWLYDSRRDPNDRFFNHSSKWTADETNVFYGALKMFGTDFDMISKMFPGRNRRMIKLKFSREERDNEWRIRAVLLGQPDPINFENYCNFTGQNASDFKDPEAFKEELKRDEEKLVAELEKDRQNMMEHQKRKQAAALQKADIARRKKNGEKVTRKRRKKVVDALTEVQATDTAADANAIATREATAQQDGDDASGKIAKGRKSRKAAPKYRPRRKNLPVQLDDGQNGQGGDATADALVESAAASEDRDTTVVDAAGAADEGNDINDPEDGNEGMGYDHDPDEPIASIE